MRNFCIFIVVNVFGAIGSALALSTVCSLAGVWAGWRLYEAYLG